MPRVSARTYYKTTSRVGIWEQSKAKTPRAQSPKRDRGSQEKQTEELTIQSTGPSVSAEKFECSCTQEMNLVNDVFPEHYDTAGIYCNGSGQESYFWRIG